VCVRAGRACVRACGNSQSFAVLYAWSDSAWTEILGLTTPKKCLE